LLTPTGSNHWLALTAVLLLAGCQGRFTADLATDAPADPQVTQVQAGLLGLELHKSDGTTATVEFTAGELVNLMDLDGGNPLALFTNQQLKPGTYDGIRLLFDDSMDATVTTLNGEFPMLVTQGDFAPVDFTVVDNQSSLETLTLALDLRQSLRFDAGAAEYTLTPRLRAVPTADAATIQGAVTATCPTASSLEQGGAVYLFQGSDVTPDDLDAVAPEPSITTSVVGDAFIGQFSYALRVVPPGDYTLALTCRGNLDDPGTNDDLAFRDVQNVSVNNGEVLQRDLN